MKIHCSKCGKSVSSIEVFPDIVIRTWVECLECAEKKYQEDIEIIEEYTRRTYSSSTASKLMEWIRDNLTPEQLETLKKTVEEINKTRMEMKNLADTMKKERL